MLQTSLFQPDLNKGKLTPADSPWPAWDDLQTDALNGQRKMGISVVYECSGEKSLQ